MKYLLLSVLLVLGALQQQAYANCETAYVYCDGEINDEPSPATAVAPYAPNGGPTGEAPGTAPSALFGSPSSIPSNALSSGGYCKYYASAHERSTSPLPLFHRLPRRNAEKGAQRFFAPVFSSPPTRLWSRLFLKRSKWISFQKQREDPRILLPILRVLLLLSFRR
jgi:hypothetical protein